MAKESSNQMVITWRHMHLILKWLKPRSLAVFLNWIVYDYLLSHPTIFPVIRLFLNSWLYFESDPIKGKSMFYDHSMNCMLNLWILKKVEFLALSKISTWKTSPMLINLGIIHIFKSYIEIFFILIWYSGPNYEFNFFVLILN